MNAARAKTLIRILLVVAVGMLVMLMFLKLSERDSWELMTTRLGEMTREAHARKPPRSVLRGIPTPGNAWEEYNIAINASINDADTILKHLSLGAQRTDGQFPYAWNSESWENPRGADWVAELTAKRAREAAGGGNSQEALDLLLDTMALARDTATNGDIFSSKEGFEAYRFAFHALHDLLQSRKLRPNQLAKLVDTLKVVEKEFPDSSVTLTNETLRIGLLLTTTIDNPWSNPIRQGDWRLAMWPRKTTADAFQRRDVELQQIKGMDQMDYLSARREIKRLSDESFAMPNTVVHESEIGLGGFLVQQRDTLARLRLLQAATTFLIAGKTDPIADPFGDKLFFEVNGRTVKIWSVGENGKNENGVGAWLSETDIVFEMAR
jgi:hypothetical protein